MAINLMDRFLSKMKAKPKHMACISVSAFHIAAVQMAQSLDADHLVSISQCKCTGGDLKRMSELIQNKLEWAPGTQPITTLTFLRLFHDMFHTVASQLGLGDIYASIVTVSYKSIIYLLDLTSLRSTHPIGYSWLNLFNFLACIKYERKIGLIQCLQHYLESCIFTTVVFFFQEFELLLRLEMVVCDGNCASLRPSEVALVLLCTYLDAAVKRLDANTDAAATPIDGSSPHNTSATQDQIVRLVQFAAELKKICKVTSDKIFLSFVFLNYSLTYTCVRVDKKNIFWPLLPFVSHISVVILSRWIAYISVQIHKSNLNGSFYQFSYLILVP